MINFPNFMTLNIFFQCFMLPELVYSNFKVNIVHTWVCMTQHTLAVYDDTHWHINFKHKLPHSKLKPSSAWGKHSCKLLWRIINVVRRCSNVPDDMICACFDLILNRNCHRLVNTCKGSLSSWEISLHLGSTSGPANKWKFLKGWFM